MKIVVTGSLGHIGKPLTVDLVQKGNNVTVISSKPEKANDIEALGAKAAIGSLEDVEFLTATFAEADALFAMVPPNYSEPDQLVYYQRIGNKYAESIHQSGVKRVVHLSSYGAHLNAGTGLILGSHHVEKILDTLPNIGVTHLRPGYFYYNLYAFLDMIKEAGIIGANYGGNDKMLLVSPTDIAAAAATALTEIATGQNIQYVASDERTASEIAQVLGAAIGRPDLQWLTFSNEQTQEAMEKKGLPTSFVNKMVELGASIHNGKLIEDYELHKPVLAKVKLEDFAKEFAVVFKGK